MKWEDRIGCRLKLHDLHVLLTVAELGSMGRAARRLSISQPSVSKAIIDIERTIGARLLVRSSRGVEATEYGRVLLQRGLGAFDELRQGIRDIEFLSDPAVGEVYVGCPEAISAGLLSAVIERFSRQYPKAVVNVINEGDLAQQLQQLRDREVDFLVRRISDALDDSLNVEILHPDRLFIVSSRDSPWGRRRKINLSELVNAPWLLSPNFYGPILADIFEASGLATPDVNVKSFSTHQTINLLATGRFVSALSGGQLYFNGSRFSLKALPVEIATRPWMMAIITLKNRTISPIAQTFMQCAREIARPLADLGLRRKAANGG